MKFGTGFFARAAKAATAVAIAVIMTAGVPVYAKAGADLEVLTLEDAVKKALNDAQMRNYRETQTKLNKEQEDLQNQLNAAYDPKKMQSLENQLLQNKSKREVNSMSMALYEKKMEITVMKAFASVISAENALVMYDKALEKESRELTVTKVKSSFDLVSESAYISAVNNYEKKVNDRISRENAINNAYTSLNNLMDRSAATRYIVKLDCEYNKMSDFNIYAAISSAKDKSPDLKKKADDASYASLLVEQYEFDISLSNQQNEDNIKTLEENRTEARRLYNDAVTTLEQKVAQGYDDLMKSEAQYDSNLLDLEILQKQHAINETKFEMGKITELELLGSRHQLEQMEETIRAQTVEHEILLKQVSNPVLLTS